MFVQLYQIKKHLNIDEYFKDDDEYLVSLEQIAESIVERHIDRKLGELVGEDGELPSPLLHAILILIANFYMQRESISYSSMTEVPQSYNYILDLFKDYSKKVENGGVFG